MAQNSKKEAEARVVAALQSKEPMTKDAALDALAALVGAGRVKKPTRGTGAS